MMYTRPLLVRMTCRVVASTYPWPTSTTPAGSGGGGGAAFETMTVTGAVDDVFPALSRTTAVSVCEPSAVTVVSQFTEYGATVASVPSTPPSSLNWTPATAEVASEAV